MAKLRERKNRKNKKWISTICWMVGLILVWEIGAVVVSLTKRTPENILPHLYQIVAAAFSTKAVARTDEHTSELQARIRNS